jgi:hypothetical protein
VVARSYRPLVHLKIELREAHQCFLDGQLITTCRQARRRSKAPRRFRRRPRGDLKVVNTAATERAAEVKLKRVTRVADAPKAGC